MNRNFSIWWTYQFWSFWDIGPQFRLIDYSIFEYPLKYSSSTQVVVPPKSPFNSRYLMHIYSANGFSSQLISFISFRQKHIFAFSYNLLQSNDSRSEYWNKYSWTFYHIIHMNMGEKLCSTKNVCTCTLCIQSMNAKDIHYNYRMGFAQTICWLNHFIVWNYGNIFSEKPVSENFLRKEWISYDEKPKRLKKSFRNALSNGILVAKIFSYFIKMFNFIVTP